MNSKRRTVRCDPITEKILRLALKYFGYNVSDTFRIALQHYWTPILNKKLSDENTE